MNSNISRLIVFFLTLIVLNAIQDNIIKAIKEAVREASEPCFEITMPHNTSILHRVECPEEG